MSEAVQIITFTPEQLEGLIRKVVRSELAGKAPANDTVAAWLNTSQAARFTGLSVRTLQNYVNDRKIPHYRDGREPIRFRREELEAWVAARKRGG
jgi:excisionase family DNA binding protein